MDIQTVAQLIGTLGFPIVCAVILSYIVKFMFEKYTTDIKELTKTHKEESDKFAEALNNNTAVLNRLCNKLDDLDIVKSNSNE